MNKMRSLSLEPKLDTYRSLITTFSKKRITSGDHLKAENLLAVMKKSGIKPTFSTMQWFMVSYGQSRQLKEVESVLKNLSTSGAALDTLTYSFVIDAHLKKGDFNAGIEKLAEMKEAGIEPDHRIWTCFIRAASLSEGANEAIILLNALQGAGFYLPIIWVRMGAWWNGDGWQPENAWELMTQHKGRENTVTMSSKRIGSKERRSAKEMDISGKH
ncbi:hypothetical protein Fmac_020722 [Flemingia macrophylla]|uniref:Pentatricopeptide repeat-containing protein n=1 Tax=Flemingia macrophylla TaxID=520843 RepID=A0ABD1LUV9_9FABA